MEKITISEAQKHLSPNSISLVCVKKPDGSTNLTTISWWTFLSNKPATIGFSISKKSYTGELIRNTSKALLSIPSAKISTEVLNCGKISGKNINKVKELDIPMLNFNGIQFPENSKLVFNCSLNHFVDVHDHYFYICSIDEILYNSIENQAYAWEGYSVVDSLEKISKNLNMEDIYTQFTSHVFGVENRYVYDAKKQYHLINSLLLNDKKELKLHFTYLPRIKGLRALADNKEVKFQRGILTFVTKDGMCHVTSKLEVSSQGVPTEYRGFAVITNPYSTGPACTCFLKEINNAFGIFILFSFRLSSIEDMIKRKTRISECMAVRKDDGTSYVYRLIISENFIKDAEMRYFEGFLKIGTNENTEVGKELNILIRRKYIDLAEKFFEGTEENFSNEEKEIYSDLNTHFMGVNKNKFAKYIQKVKSLKSFSTGILTIDPNSFNLKEKDDLLFLGWLRKNCLSAKHDKVEKILDDNIEELHKIIYPELHLNQNNLNDSTVIDYDSRISSTKCSLKSEIISFFSTELSEENVYKYSEKDQQYLIQCGKKCNSCNEKNENCDIIQYYNASVKERRKICETK